MENLLDFASTGMAIALVALSLILLQRSQGIVILEIIPLSTALVLIALGSLRKGSASTLDTATLIIPLFACAALVVMFQPLYAKWRLRVAGESTTLLLSFASMNCCLSAMTATTSNRSISLALADSYLVGTKDRLEWAVIATAGVALTGIMLYLRQRRLVAALQLSKDDFRLLQTFGRDPDQVRRHVLAVAIVACTVGMILFVSLQETFSVSNCYAVLIPSFAIAISQNRIRAARLVTASVLLITAEGFLTQHTSELLRAVHRAALFSFFILIGVISQRVTSTAIALKWRRRFFGFARRPYALQP